VRSIRRLVWIVVAVTCGLLGWAPIANAAPAPGRPTVVLVAVPGLRWSDVETMPALRALAAQSSVGELSVKTKSGVTRCAAGLLAVSAGNRTEGLAGICNIDISTWPQLVRVNEKSRYDAKIGSLGAALQAHHVTTVAVTELARPMLANRQGNVDVVAPNLATALKTGGVIALLDRRLYSVTPPLRAAADAAIDAKISTVEKSLPSDTVLMVAGVSGQAIGRAQLQVFIAHGPGWAHTELRSSAAGRSPFVQLIDLAPTILATQGISAPASMVGRPMQQHGSVPSISSFVDDNRHAQEQRTLGQRVFMTLGIAAIVMIVLAATPLAATRVLGRWLARLVAPAPAFVFIANAFPWWRWGQPSYAALVLTGCIVLAAATTLAARRSVTAAMLVVPIFTVVALATDQLTGANLQLSAPLGDSPLIAGRFAGMGNLDFAVFATSSLIVAGVVAGRLARKQALLSAAAIMAFAVVIDGAPQLGNDIGGVLALLPASIVVVAMVAQVRLSRRRVIAVVLTTVFVAAAIAVADYSRPANEQTDVGRFVGQVLHGGASTEVRRKADAALASIGLTIGTFVVGFVIAAAIVARGRIRRALATSRGVAAAAVAATVLAFLGTSLNDSGITVAAMAAIVAVSAIYGSGFARSPKSRMQVQDSDPPNRVAPAAGDPTPA
jgi:hypothetical protein